MEVKRPIAPTECSFEWGQALGPVTNGEGERDESRTTLRWAPALAYAGEMARPLRIAPPGGIFHVTARGNRRQEIFFDDRDRLRFLEMFGTAVSRHDWRCHAYCLMPNHFHLMIETPAGDISAGMQRLNGGYAQWFNRRHEFDGHLFQSRFYSVLLESNWHLLELSRYIVLNPVRARLCRDPAEWRWSSYRAYMALARRPEFLTVDWLLEQFGSDSQRARTVFRRFVGEALTA
jgi:REP element-mobilizing transposase RayT